MVSKKQGGATIKESLSGVLLADTLRMRTFKKSKKFVSKGRKYQTGSLLKYRDPPTLVPTIPIFHRFSFLCQGDGGELAIQNAFISRWLLSAQFGSATGLELIAAFRIKSIETWQPVAEGQEFTATSRPLTFTWRGEGFASDRTEVSQSLSRSRPSYIFSRPPKGSAASFWQTGANTIHPVYSMLSQTVGARMDVVMEFTLQNGVASSTTLTSPAGGNYISYGRMDGAGGNWVAITGGGTGTAE